MVSLLFLGMYIQFGVFFPAHFEPSNDPRTLLVWWKGILQDILIISLWSLLHTYIIHHHNPLVRITTWLLTPLMLCALFLSMSGATYSLKSTLNNRFVRNFSWQFYLLFRVFARNLLRGNRLRNTFRISF